MDPAINPAYAVLAAAFMYPGPGRLAALASASEGLPNGAVRGSYSAFIRGIEPLTLGAWEELHTRTLDLNPPAAPYIGYQMWGDSYQRGAFLAKMNRALAEAEVDKDGELPDHLVPCLRYLAVTNNSLPELVEALGPAVDRMLRALRESQPDNPYVSLLQAVQAAAQGLADQGSSGVRPAGISAKKEAA